MNAVTYGGALAFPTPFPKAERAGKPRPFPAWILDALKESRRQQARRVIKELAEATYERDRVD